MDLVQIVARRTDRRQMATHCTESPAQRRAGVGGILGAARLCQSTRRPRQCCRLDIETFAAWSGWDDADICSDH